MSFTHARNFQFQITQYKVGVNVVTTHLSIISTKLQKMAIITGSWILDFGFFISTLFFSLYLFYLHRFNFWKKVNVVHTNPGFPFADLKGVGSVRSAGEMFRDLYDQHKHLPYLGMWMFFKPNLLINDPELIKTIFVKEFATFQDRGMYANEKDPLSGESAWIPQGPSFKKNKNKMKVEELGNY